MIDPKHPNQSWLDMHLCGVPWVALAGPYLSNKYGSKQGPVGAKTELTEGVRNILGSPLDKNCISLAGLGKNGFFAIYFGGKLVRYTSR